MRDLTCNAPELRNVVELGERLADRRRKLGCKAKFLAHCASTLDPVEALKERINFYARGAHYKAMRNLERSKSLRILSAVASLAAVVIAVCFPMQISADGLVSGILVCCGVLVSLLLVVQLIAAPEQASVALLTISRDFAGVGVKVVQLEAEILTRPINEQQSLARLERLHEEYLLLRDMYLEHPELRNGRSDFRAVFLRSFDPIDLTGVCAPALSC